MSAEIDAIVARTESTIEGFTTVFLSLVLQSLPKSLTPEQATVLVHNASMIAAAMIARRPSAADKK